MLLWLTQPPEFSLEIVEEVIGGLDRLTEQPREIRDQDADVDGNTPRVIQTNYLKLSSEATARKWFAITAKSVGRELPSGYVGRENGSNTSGADL